ncbi:MAG: type II secretion system F family protein [Marmoricola sp.]
MSAVALIAAVAAAGATALLVTPRSPPARGDPVDPAGDGARAAPAVDETAVLVRLRVPLSALAFAAGWAFLGGFAGVLAGAVAAVAAWVVLGRAESPAVRRRRERLQRDLPVGVDLLASCLTAGGAIGPALGLVADALPGPLAEEFGRLRHRLALGADPGEVWRGLAEHPQLAPLGRTLLRTHETGASVGRSIHRLAAELRAETLAGVEQRARSVDVKAAAPLGVCFLPAFLLVGVVPLVAGIFASMTWFG